MAGQTMEGGAGRLGALELDAEGLIVHGDEDVVAADL